MPNGGVFHTINLHVFNYSNNNPVRYVDPDGRLPMEGMESSSAYVRGSTTQHQNGNSERHHFHFSPFGPAQNDVHLVWAEAIIDHTNGASLNLSAGIVDFGGNTDTTVFVGGDFNILTGSLDVGITDDGVGFGFNISAISLSGRIGTQFDVGDRNISASIGGSVGVQKGGEVVLTRESFVLDVAIIFGGRIEVNWGRNR
ncbi:MAG: hypothetical protein FWC91_13575 [Defluviitaleaceae bacterium]|nr:hypothetical protein [Defluviitaleaceae bacterium]